MFDAPTKTPFKTPSSAIRTATFTLLISLVFLALPSGSALARYASLIMDVDTKQVLYSRNADTQLYPASLTKMMTLYMVFEALDKGRIELKDRMPVSKRAAGQPPSKLGLKVGSSISVGDAIKVLVTKSANDVATVVAEYLGATESKFAALMTKRARQLGMERTSFRNASGLPNSGQVSTARDMATLGMALREDFPQYYHYFSIKSFKYGNRTIRTHNRVLLQYKGAEGMKTGYIRASGFNLVSAVKRDGRTLIGVVFGGKTSRSRDKHMMSLLDKGFAQARQFAALPPPQRKPTDTPAAAQVASIAPAADAVAVEATAPLIAPEDDARPSVGQKTWGIQVGAFSSFSTASKQAMKALQVLQPAISGHPTVTALSANNGLIYRARLMGLTTEDVARKACGKLKANQTKCVVVPPDGLDVASIRGNATTTTR